MVASYVLQDVGVDGGVLRLVGYKASMGASTMGTTVSEVAYIVLMASTLVRLATTSMVSLIMLISRTIRDRMTPSSTSEPDHVHLGEHPVHWRRLHQLHRHQHK